MMNKITYINSIIAFFLASLGVVFIYENNPEFFTDTKELMVLIIIIISFVLTVAIFTQLIGKSVMDVVWATRLLMVLSVLWVLGCTIFFEPWKQDVLFYEYINLSDFIFSGMIPIVVLWGVVWVAKAVIKE